MFLPVLLRFSGSAINSGGRPSSTGVQDWSYYFDGSAYLEIPLNIDPSTLPSVTIGAWVKPASQDDTLPLARYATSALFVTALFIFSFYLLP